MRKVHLISLGCPKNQVDSEKLLSRLSAYDILYSADPAEAGIIIVNTCGFIGAAKEESINEILNAAALKSGPGRKKLVVYGCLAKRYGEELLREIPEIDALWGVAEDEAIADYCRSILGKRSVSGKADAFHDKPYAYLKIGEGCDRGCSYCVIPGIRGSYRSTEPDQVLSAAEEYLKSGMKELIVVAQDITSYGKDLRGYDLPRLIKEIAAIHGDFRIRLLYLYPTAITDTLLETIASTDNVCNYIDMPLQHTEKNILRLMGRGGSRAYFEKMIIRIRQIIPDVALRTTVIVGFPQETEDDFDNMLASIRRMKFDRLGAFTYSKEPGTPAAALKGQIPKRIRQSRYERLMEAQAPLSLRKNQEIVGRSFRALVDDTDGGVAIARLCSQAPEIDGVVILKDSSVAKGDFVKVMITRAGDYDIEGTVIR